MTDAIEEYYYQIALELEQDKMIKKGLSKKELYDLEALTEHLKNSTDYIEAYNLYLAYYLYGN